jgi:hypothetical protein
MKHLHAVSNTNYIFRFLELTATIRTSHLCEFTIILTLIGTCTDKEVKQFQLPPTESDTVFLGAIDFFVGTVREVITQEPNSKIMMAHKFLSKPEAVKLHLSKFLNSTKSIAGDESTKLADWLRIVFELRPEVHNAEISHIRGFCNERVAFTELDKYVRQLESGNVQSAPLNDFPSRELFEAWRQAELSKMSGFRRACMARHPHIRPVSFDMERMTDS